MPAPGGLTESSGFAAGGKIYVGTGQWFSTGDRLNQFWEYNPSTNTWRAVNELPGMARDDASAFSIGDKGYIGTGTNGTNLQDFWEFDADFATGIEEANNNISVSVFPNPMTESSQFTVYGSPLSSSNGTVYDLQF